MQKQSYSVTTEDFTHKAVEASIKIGLIFLLLNWCFYIASPFITPLAWAVIIAVALYPAHQQLSSLIQARETLSATLITVILLIIILGPCWFLANMIGDNIQTLMEKLHQGDLTIPAPAESVASWPLIGERIFNLWQQAANDFDTVLKTLAPQIKTVAHWLLASGKSTLESILQLLVAVIICGMLLVNGQRGHQLSLSISQRVIGDKGEELTNLCIATIRGVARGILGVALIQSFLAWLGFWFANVPCAGLLAVVCMFIATVQLPSLILTLPSVIYVFSTQPTSTALIFAAWILGVGLLDNILKPILMGHGLNLPMAVVFIGAIGGMIYSGIIGLFVGAVVLALGYKLFMSWLDG